MMPTTKATPEDCPLREMFPKTPASEDSHKIDTRVGRLEGVVETITRDVQEMSRSVSALGKEIGDLRNLFTDSMSKLRDMFSSQIDMVAGRLSQSARPNWQAIIAIVALAGALAAYVMNANWQAIQEAKAKLVTSEEHYARSQYEKGRTDAFVEEAGVKLRSLDEKVQREMVLVNNATEAKLAGLDVKVQQEMREIRRALESTAMDAKEQIIDLRKWRLDSAATTAANDAKLNAKQEMVVERLNKMEDRQWSLRERLRLFNEDPRTGEEKKP
jgi:hypothetical protein